MSSAKKFKAIILAMAVWALISCIWPAFAAETEPVPKPGAAAEEAPPVAPPKPPEETLGPEEEVGPTVAITPAGLISFDFREAPIGDVLRLFARQVKINIVTTPSVQGTVTMKLDNVHWRKALNLVLEVNKLKMTEDKENNIIKVMTEGEVQAEPLETRIYALNYVQADDALKVLQPLLAENEKIQADVPGNKLIANARPATHEKLTTVIRELDLQTKQVAIEVRLIDSKKTAGRDLGIKWDQLKEYPMMKARTPYTLSESISDYARDLSREFARSERDLGRLIGKREEVRFATLTPGELNVTLSLLFKDEDTKLIGNPRVSTVDNKEATIKVARQWPIPKWQFNSDTGTWEVQGFEFKDIGVILKVTPHINQDNFVTLDISPEVSDSKERVIFGGGSSGVAQIPIIDTRTATTRVIVKSSETVVIGGLLRTDEYIAKSGVPLLKEIPILGELFKHSSKVSEDRDLVIFITPTVLEGAAASIVAPPPELTPGAAAEKAK